MYDVFRSLAGAPVRALSAHAIDPRSTAYLRNDNFVATAAYEDGTVATLTYTAMGPKAVGKERIEIFCDGDAYVIEDFKQLVRGSDGTTLWEARDPDKGHATEIGRLVQAVRAGEAPIPFDELVETTALSLHVEDLLVGRVEEP